jgi:hypothetical protein
MGVKARTNAIEGRGWPDGRTKKGADCRSEGLGCSAKPSGGGPLISAQAEENSTNTKVDGWSSPGFGSLKQDENYSSALPISMFAKPLFHCTRQARELVAACILAITNIEVKD